jgi:hypothetical protein
VFTDVKQTLVARRLLTSVFLRILKHICILVIYFHVLIFRSFFHKQDLKYFITRAYIRLLMVVIIRSEAALTEGSLI